MSDPSNTDLTTQQGGVPVIQEGPANLLQSIMQLARDPSVRVDVIQSLVQMQERMEDRQVERDLRQAERDFAASLRRAQAMVKQVERRSFVDLTKSGETPKPGAQRGYFFASDEDLDDMLRPIMDECGFSIFYDRTTREGGGLIVTATLLHEAGHSKTSSFPLPIDTGPGRNNLQALGSTDSYAHRYLKEGFFNVVRRKRDDDGVAAGKKYLSEEQSTELRDLITSAGFVEADWLQRRAGNAIRSVDEVEQQSFVILSNMLRQVIAQRATKKDA